MKQGSGKSNKVVDGLKQRTMLLNAMIVEVVTLESMKGLYEEDAHFAEAWKACKASLSMDKTLDLNFLIQEGLLFKNQWLFIPHSSLQLNLIMKIHSGSLGGHFGTKKTTTLVIKRFFCSRINKDVINFVECCKVC